MKRINCTFLQSFGKKLLNTSPEIINSCPTTYRPLQTSVVSTPRTPIMGACIKENMSVFKPFENKYLAKSPNSALANYQIRNWGIQPLRTVGDVRALSSMQLLLPVQLALNEVCPERHAITISGDEVRTYMHFELFSLDTQQAVKRLTTVKFTNTNVLSKADFEPACLTETAYKEFIDRKAIMPHRKTLFQRNAITITQQVAKYAAHCYGLVVFDYGGMMVFDFSSDIP
ncbi:hypothetical protein TRVA0_023S00848 [Trichomonascus vanleenenianus]|uniref:uncharacterized protein n=1 Tax=Trichomonascus vanleenenianus TaxID=2268995 RepID=UPI003ECA00D4